MKLRLTFDLDDNQREAIAAYYGQKGKASRQECETFIFAAVRGQLEGIDD